MPEPSARSVMHSQLAAELDEDCLKSPNKLNISDAYSIFGTDFKSLDGPVAIVYITAADDERDEDASKPCAASVIDLAKVNVNAFHCAHNLLLKQVQRRGFEEEEERVAFVLREDRSLASWLQAQRNSLVLVDDFVGIKLYAPDPDAANKEEAEENQAEDALRKKKRKRAATIDGSPMPRRVFCVEGTSRVGSA